MGLDADDLAPALEALAAAKRVTAPLEATGNSIFKQKELVYEDESAFIYQRGDTKRGIYYLRIYDTNSKRPYVKSLKTTDRVKALATARNIYHDVRGKIDRGEKLKTITTKELVDIFLEKQRLKITDIPKQGITPMRYRQIEYVSKIWLEYVTEELGCGSIGIDKIKPERCREFGYWFRNKPRRDGKSDPRSIEMVNNGISLVRKIYKDVAIRDKYITTDQAPEIDRLTDSPEDGHARDIFSLEEYDTFWRFCIHKYIKDKTIDEVEKQKRIIFYNSFGILMASGLRPKEYLGLKLNEISFLDNDTTEEREERMKITIRSSNSKTGRGRVVVCPITKRVNRIKAAYEALGVPHKPTDYLVFNPASPTRKHYSREQLGNRLHKVLELSGLKETFAREGKTINLYSTRHTWFTWRLRFGNVPIHLLAKAGGNSVEKISKVYSHVRVEQQADILTRAQGFTKSAELDIALANNQFWYEDN